MKVSRRYSPLNTPLLLIPLLLFILCCKQSTVPISGTSDNSDSKSAALQWASDIEELVKDDLQTEFPEDAVVFAGSSSIRLWESLADDMAPIHVIRRGFGGARIDDVLYWAPEIILKYKTNKVVLFAGTNDFSGNEHDNSPEYVLEKSQELFDLIHENNPHASIYYLSITPNRSRWNVWPNARKANRLIKEYAAETSYLVFLDFADQFLLDDGMPDPELFLEDELHLSEKGYEIWTKELRSVLLGE